jgi:2-keto-4-pentenoate hydratase/2-oxohepta-3-ene-1,7-dioic acid hydratase in catechol pathway
MPLAHIKDTDESIEIRKILCIGRNYPEHVKEMKAEVPDAPVFFLKPATAVVHDGGKIIRPTVSRELHHEVEMTVLIGRGGKNVRRDEAPNHVAGYGVGLDMTLRDVQNEAKKKGAPWTLAKAFDTAAPISAFVPATMIADPHNLELDLTVNGTTRQHSSTGNVIFRVPVLIEYISRFCTLERGDVLFTGTPEGVSATIPGDRLEAHLLSSKGTVLTSLRVTVE